MPPAISDSDTVRFLVAVIECTNNGKPDFNKVQQVLNLNTAGAARERYRRIILRYGINNSSNNSNGSSTKSATSTPRKRKAELGDTPPDTPVKEESGKKRAAGRKRVKVEYTEVEEVEEGGSGDGDGEWRGGGEKEDTEE